MLSPISKAASTPNANASGAIYGGVGGGKDTERSEADGAGEAISQAGHRP